MNPLADHFRVLAPDLLGSGCSARCLDADYSLQGHLSRLEALLEEKSVEEAGVVGNSYGGTLALLLAAQYPHRVSRLVLVAPAVFVKNFPLLIRFLRSPVLGHLALRLPASLAARLALRRAFANHSRIQSEAVKRYALEMGDAEAREALRRTALGLPRIDSRKIVETLAQVAQPSLIIWGRRDNILPYQQGERLSLELPHSTLCVLQNSGHAPQEEVPLEFLRVSLRFLQKMGDTESSSNEL